MTEHIDPEVIRAAYELLPREPDREDVEAALKAADEKRRELAQADPEGQEYAYRVSYTNRTNGPVWYRGSRDLQDAADRHKEIATEGYEACVERALLGTWERV